MVMVKRGRDLVSLVLASRSLPPGRSYWVVTEYGAVDLFGKSLRERAESLIAIAHPDCRADLRRVYAETRHVDLTPRGTS